MSSSSHGRAPRRFCDGAKQKGVRILRQDSASGSRLGRPMPILGRFGLCGERALDHQDELEQELGIKATPYEASKTCGLRFYQRGWDLNDRDHWPEYIAWQLDAAVKLRSAVRKIDSRF